MKINPDQRTGNSFESLEGVSRQVAEMLLERGWNVEVKSGKQPQQVDTEPGGLVECGDGRLQGKVKGSEARPGPKLFGGVFAVMAGRKNGSVKAFKYACSDIFDTGYVPTVHKDEAGHLCGKEGLWREGRLDDLPKLEVGEAEARELVIEEHGATVDLKGEHQEKRFSINFVSDTTRNPDDGQFHNDAWYINALDLYLDPVKVLERAAETVEKLTRVRTAEIWV
jgi:hypothetical protein